MQQLRGRTLRAITALLLFLLVAAGFTPQSAYALSSVCRSDPLVVLSNGAALDMNVVLQTSASNVDHVGYRLHIPRSLRVVAVVSTRLVDGLPATVEVINDAAPDIYWTETTAYTRVANVEVSAQSALVLLTHVVVSAGTANGKEQQALRVDLHR